ncbi:MAG: hypothetical protein QFX33_03090 [Candidatus Nezhaarchaeota archaeon]|nr:hypothetical protein [Candidatus Nezhaarchaeota archaeon]
MSGEGLPKEIVLTVVGNGEKVFKCRFCGAFFVGLSDAKRHVERPDPHCLEMRRKSRSVPPVW